MKIVQQKQTRNILINKVMAPDCEDAKELFAALGDLAEYWHYSGVKNSHKQDLSRNQDQTLLDDDGYLQYRIFFKLSPSY